MAFEVVDIENVRDEFKLASILVRGDLRADSLTCLSDTVVTGKVSVRALELSGYGLIAQSGLFVGGGAVTVEDLEKFQLFARA